MVHVASGFGKKNYIALLVGVEKFNLMLVEIGCPVIMVVNCADDKN